MIHKLPLFVSDLVYIYCVYALSTFLKVSNMQGEFDVMCQRKKGDIRDDVDHKSLQKSLSYL